ncbi:MAG TPA: branched-chain amino acid ABC transporter permease [Hyphomicrobiaceae bacterium]|nr:branched-chain amino acid ABC transporter permease [Hyphomicrobiaceae bacterium]
MFIDIFIFGTIWGAIYTILALGFTLIFGVVRILNLAYGAIYMVASYLIYSLVSSLGLAAVPAWCLAVIASTLFGVVLYVVFVYPMRDSLGRVLIVTAGIAIFLQEVAVLVYSTEPRYVPTVLPGGLVIFDVRVTYQQILTLFAAAALVAILHAILVRTRLGRELRAVAQDTEMASLMGIPVERAYLTAMALSSALAGAAGALVAPFLTVNPEMGWSPLLVAFTIVVLGGLGSLWGTIVAAFIVAYAENLTAFLISPQLRDVATFAIMILTLVFRPHGLFGKGIVE